MNPEQAEALDDGDWPPLVRCIFEENAPQIRDLIARGEDPNSSFAGMSLLALATYHGLPDVVEALIAGGATVPPDALSLLGDQDITDWKIDPVEVEPDYARVAQILLANGATPNADAYNGKPLITTFPEDRYPHMYRVLADALSSFTGRNA